MEKKNASVYIKAEKESIKDPTMVLKISAGISIADRRGFK